MLAALLVCTIVFAAKANGPNTELLTCNLNITTTSNSIAVDGLTEPHVILKLFNPDWSINFECTDNCANPTVLSSLAAGTYYLSVNMYDANWQQTCEQAEYVTITGGGCPDNDNDGVCAADDCNDNNPTIPTTPGTACDDGDPNTNNDVIQSDGCTCAGTPTGGGCDVSWTTSSNSITITGLTAGHVIFKLFNPNWTIHTQCFDNCSDPLIISGLTGGATYHISYNLYDPNWQPICDETADVTISGGGNLPDLSIADLEAEAVGSPGAVMGYSFDLDNNGTAPATGSYVINAYVSDDNNLSPDDALAGDIATGNTPVGTIPNVPGSITVPDLPGGNYYLILEVDANNEITESSENNNIAATPFQISEGGGEECGFLSDIAITTNNTLEPMATTAREEVDGYILIYGERFVFDNVEEQSVVLIDLAGNLVTNFDQTTYYDLILEVTVTPDFDLNFVRKNGAGVIIFESLIDLNHPTNTTSMDGFVAYEFGDGYVVFASRRDENGDYELIAVLTDDMGNELNEDRIATGDMSTPREFLEGPFGNGIYRTFEFTSELVAKIDAAGNFSWQSFAISDLPSTDVNDMEISPDGQYLWLGIVDNLKARLARYDMQTGDAVSFLLSDIFSPESDFSTDEFLIDIAVADNGDVVTGYGLYDVGTGEDLYEYGRMDQNGNLVWWGRLPDEGFNVVMGPKLVTSDGGFLFVGTVGLGGFPPQRRVSVMKVTSDGLLTPDCDDDPGSSTPLPCGLSYTLNGGTLTISGPGLSGGHVIAKLFGPSWNTIFNCLDDCGDPIVISGLGAGTHHLSVNLYDANWQGECSFLEDIEIGSGNPLQGTESDYLFFTAAKNAGAAVLNWVYNNDLTTDHFAIERSADGDVFHPIGMLQTGGEGVHHHYEDLEPATGFNYYRIVQVFSDESIRYSATRQLHFEGVWSDMVLYPNPVSDQLHVSLKAYAGQSAVIRVYNALGVEVAFRQIAEIDDAPVAIPVGEWSSGVYHVAVELGDRKRMVQRVVVGRR